MYSDSFFIFLFMHAEISNVIYAYINVFKKYNDYLGKYLFSKHNSLLEIEVLVKRLHHLSDILLLSMVLCRFLTSLGSYRFMKLFWMNKHRTGPSPLYVASR